MQVEKLRDLVCKRKVIWSEHARTRMRTRNISRKDVINCILYGYIIEDYPNAFPYPSCLMFGAKQDGTTIHVVIGTDDKYAYIITTYYPGLDKFEKDLKTRRN